MYKPLHHMCRHQTALIVIYQLPDTLHPVLYTGTQQPPVTMATYDGHLVIIITYPNPRLLCLCGKIMDFIYSIMS